MEPGIGPSAERSLRVSAATLARVVFPHPDNGTLLLALEHKATVNPGEDGPQVHVQAQPFGGAVRLLQPDALFQSLAGFNYDSKRSLREQDFRLYIQPASWDDLMALCHNLPDPQNPLIEVDPSRELQEEFADSLNLALEPGQVAVRPLQMLAEGEPMPTANLRAPGRPTARIYWTHEVTILDGSLGRLILAQAEGHSAADLAEAALARAQDSGWGRANGVLAAPLAQVTDAYHALPMSARSEPVPFGGTRLASNVAAVLGVDSPRYETLEEAH